MGCSSGGAAVRDENSVSGTTGTKMVHFRTLDWGMDPLRRVLVQLDYVLEPNGEIVASSINYAGFVGVLTGVRKGLSLSLNFRGVHNGSNELLANVKYYGYLAMVVLGLRPSISSTLRSYLIPGVYGNKRDGASGETGFANLPDYGAVVQEEDANERKACAERNYRKLVRRRSKASQAGGDREVNAVSNNLLPAADDIVGMVQEHPKSNECTHFAAVMDPVAGKFAWCRYWRRPIEC